SNAAGAVVVTVTGSSNFSGGTAAPAVGTVADRDYFRRALAGATTITGVTNETLQLDRPVVIAVPVSPENSQLVVGAVIGELSGSDLAGHLRSQLGPFEDLYIVDGAGRLVGRAAVPSATAADLTGDPLVAEMLAGTPVSGEVRDPVTGTTRLLNSAPVGATGQPGWTVV